MYHAKNSFQVRSTFYPVPACPSLLAASTSAPRTPHGSSSPSTPCRVTKDDLTVNVHVRVTSVTERKYGQDNNKHMLVGTVEDATDSMRIFGWDAAHSAHFRSLTAGASYLITNALPEFDKFNNVERKQLQFTRSTTFAETPPLVIEDPGVKELNALTGGQSVSTHFYFVDIGDVRVTKENQPIRTVGVVDAHGVSRDIFLVEDPASDKTLDRGNVYCVQGRMSNPAMGKTAACFVRAVQPHKLSEAAHAKFLGGFQAYSSSRKRQLETVVPLAELSNVALNEQVVVEGVVCFYDPAPTVTKDGRLRNVFTLSDAAGYAVDVAVFDGLSTALPAFQTGKTCVRVVGKRSGYDTCSVVGTELQTLQDDTFTPWKARDLNRLSTPPLTKVVDILQSHAGTARRVSIVATVSKTLAMLEDSTGRVEVASSSGTDATNAMLLQARNLDCSVLFSNVRVVHDPATGACMLHVYPDSRIREVGKHEAAA